MVRRSSLRSVGCRRASPQGLFTKLPPRPARGPQSSACGCQYYLSLAQSPPKAGEGETPGQNVRSRSVIYGVACGILSCTCSL